MGEAKKILLIDDDQAVLAYLMAKLAPHYALVSTTDPHQAVDLAKAEQPDLVLCDIDMPGMGGGDVVAALAENPRTAGIPVMYLTALVSPEETRDMGGNVGGRPGVAKRAPIAELLQRIDELLAK